MQSKATTVAAYMAELPDEHKAAMQQLRTIINKNLPKGFKEEMSYGMIGFVVPHSIYPPGYHCSPNLPLPFISIASQKNFIALYHMGIFATPVLLQWFTTQYATAAMGKPDVGKSCIRFKKPENIPYELIGELCCKITVDDWIEIYEKNYKPL